MNGESCKPTAVQQDKPVRRKLPRWRVVMRSIWVATFLLTLWAQWFAHRYHREPFALPVANAGFVLVIAGLVPGALGGWRTSRGWTVYGAAIFVWMITAFLLSDARYPVYGPYLAGLCQSNLHYIQQGLVCYENENHGTLPPDLTALIAQQLAYQEGMVCPATSSGGSREYFYHPKARREDYPDRDNCLLACDYRGNHGFKLRVALFAGGSTAALNENDFQAILARPDNAEFAAALRIAESQLPPLKGTWAAPRGLFN